MEGIRGEEFGTSVITQPDMTGADSGRNAGLGQILVVDDDVVCLGLLRHILSAAGYEVTTFTSAREALDALKTGTYDLLLSDLMMPEMDGVSLLRAALEADPCLVGILMTGEGSVPTAVDAMKVGAFDYLVKPLEYRMLPPLLSRALGVRRMRRENIGLRETVEVYERRLGLQEALQRSEERFRNLTENTSDLMWEVDEQGVYSYVSPRVRDILGYEPEELIGKSPFHLMPPGEAERLAKLFGAISGERKPFSSVENINLHKAGYPVILETSGVPVFDAGGAFRGYRGIDRDITERKRAEEALRKEQGRARQYLDIAGVVMVALDQEGKITLLNKRGYELLGYSEGELLGRDWFGSCLPEGRREEVARAFRKVMGGAADPFEYYENPVLTRSGEERLVAWHNAVLRDSSGKIIGTISSGEDITERRMAEDRIIRVNRLYSVLSKINEAIVRIHDPLELYRRTCEISVEDGCFRMCWIGLVDPDTRSVNPVVSSGQDEGYLKGNKISINEELPEGRGPTGTAVREGRYVVCNDIAHDPAMTAWRKGALERGYRSAAAFPLKIEREVIGTINLYAGEPHYFTEEEIRLLLSLSDDISFAIASMDRERRRKEEAEISKALLEMVETLNTSLDERELIGNVIRLAPKYLKLDRAGIFFRDENLRGYTFSGGYGFTPVEEGTLLARAFRREDFPAIDKLLKGETITIENARESDLLGRELADTFHFGSLIAVPISFRGGVIGGIVGDYKKIKVIEQKDVSLLKGLSNGITIALQNSRLYRESVERLMELSGKIETIETMAHLDREILSNVEKAAILKTATALISRVIPSERTAVILKEGDHYRAVSEWGIGESGDKSYSIRGSHFESFDKSRISLYINDISEDDCPYHREQHGFGLKSALLVPLVTRDAVIGFLEIGSAHRGRLTPAHLSTAEKIASQITVALENARLYEELQQLLISTITSLASAIDAKSPWTKGHSERVTKYALEIGRAMGLSGKELESLRLSGLLHDVGKIGTYDVLLDKPDGLTDEEFMIVKKHPQKGAEILAPIRQLKAAIPGILYHHERYDGTGYPEGLSGEDIPLHARVLCVADSFDSMTADRPYRPSQGREYAISEFIRCKGTQFDPAIVETFLKLIRRGSTE